MTLFILPAFLIFFLTLCIIERSNILLSNQKLLGIIFHQSVFGIGLLFCCKHLSIFNAETFTLGSFLTPNSSKAAFDAL